MSGEGMGKVCGVGRIGEEAGKGGQSEGKGKS